MKRNMLKITGILCIIAGIAGLFLPGIQGILLIITGLALLGYDIFKKR